MKVIILIKDHELLKKEIEDTQRVLDLKIANTKMNGEGYKDLLDISVKLDKLIVEYIKNVQCKDCVGCL